MNPRYWGTLMGSVHAGVNFPYLACLAALGRPFPQTDYQPITYADKSVALKQALQMVVGRSLLAGFRFRNTALSVALKDPLPALAHYWKTIVDSTVARAARASRRSRNDSS
jgi:hypothetical protein